MVCVILIVFLNVVSLLPRNEIIKDKSLILHLQQVRSKHILPVARPDPEVVAMLTSGLTASIALEKVTLHAQKI